MKYIKIVDCWYQVIQEVKKADQSNIKYQYLIEMYGEEGGPEEDLRRFNFYERADDRFKLSVVRSEGYNGLMYKNKHGMYSARHISSGYRVYALSRMPDINKELRIDGHRFIGRVIRNPTWANPGNHLIICEADNHAHIYEKTTPYDRYRCIAKTTPGGRVERVTSSETKKMADLVKMQETMHIQT